MNNIVKVINTLSHFPYRCKRYNKKNWKGQDVHVFPIDRYLVFFVICQKDSEVTIIRIMYGGRDINAQL